VTARLAHCIAVIADWSYSHNTNRRSLTLARRRHGLPCDRDVSPEKGRAIDIEGEDALTFLSRILIVGCCLVLANLCGMRTALAAKETAIPAWLQAHVGDDDGQISKVVLLRARALYLQKVKAGEVRNPCYFAMDATRPHDMGNNRIGRRFYVICEASEQFQAIAAGHGSGLKLGRVANFSNGRRCVRNFGNAMDSNLTTGGIYLTGDTKKTFKGYYKVGGEDEPLLRTFLQFSGEGDTANAKERAIGGHPAVRLGGMCRMKDPDSQYANKDGFVPFGKLVDYAGGRSDGCTSWSQTDAKRIISMVKNNPTTLYIYPQSRDIAAVDAALAAGKSPSSEGLYWNESCLKEIGAPKFWHKESLEPIIAQYKKDHPPGPFRELPICQAN
jgi:hypothetical protein